MPRQLVIDVIEGPHQGETLIVPENGSLLVGRLPHCGLSLPTDLTVSREHFRIELSSQWTLVHLSDTRFTRVTNNSTGSTVELTVVGSKAQLNPGDDILFGLLSVIRVRCEMDSSQRVPPLHDIATAMPNQYVAVTGDDGQKFESSPPIPQFFKADIRTHERIDSIVNSESLGASIRNFNSENMFDRLGKLVSVMQQAASTADFAKDIATAALEMVQLDRAAVLAYNGSSWSTVALAEQRLITSESNWQPSQKLLNQLVRDRKTLSGKPGKITAASSASMSNLVAVVAVPVFDLNENIIGAVYGDRRIDLNRPQIDRIDTKLIEIMACGVAGGWARIEQEQASLARRVQLERFVTKEIARRLEEDPDVLNGKYAEVTLLFCDIAGFSRISEKLTSKKVFEWINAVMEELTRCVLATNGTLVDYVGDELIAMWGAPLATENHAAAAAETALMMVRALKKLNEELVLPPGETTQVGIGLNSGSVQVGNTGSNHKMKYGPLGSPVNIASRVQGATRYLKTPTLITGETAALLGDQFNTRRLCSVRLKNIDTPIDLFELRADPEPSWGDLVSQYESALKSWESLDLQAALTSLIQLASQFNGDGPAMVLLSRAVENWSQQREIYDPVWTLPSK